MRPRLLPLLLLPVLALGALSACGDESASDTSGSASEASPSPTAASEVPSSPLPTPTLPTMSPPTAPPSTPSDSFQRVRVTGTVSEVDGCLVLTDGNGVTWELQGAGLDALEAGQQVVVTGKGLPGDGTCGAPLSVTTVEVTAN